MSAASTASTAAAPGFFVREEYVATHGNERFFTLLGHKLFGRLQRTLPLAGLRRACLRALGVHLDLEAGERPPWIAADVYIDDTFPELVTIGSGAVLGVRCLVICHDDATRRVAPVRIGHRCYIGAGAILLPGVTIGDDAIVGAGAVVTRSVPPGETWAGVPARRLGQSSSIPDEPVRACLW